MTASQPGRVTVEAGVRFGTGGGRDLCCDVYQPPNQAPGAPAVLLIHGGGWASGDRSQLKGYGILLGRRGYVCVACEYRLSGEACWPAQLHDVKAALRWMRVNSGSLGIDPRKIAVSGNSAGGHLALMLAGTPNVPEFEGEGGNADAGTEVAAVIAFYAPTLLARSPGELSPVVSSLLGETATDAVIREASPITYASAAFPPTLLIHGGRDELVPVDASVQMYTALADAGVDVGLHIYEGAPHAFDAVPEFGRQCAELMALFLDRHVVNPRPVVLPAIAGL